MPSIQTKFKSALLLTLLLAQLSTQQQQNPHHQSQPTASNHSLQKPCQFSTKTSAPPPSLLPPQTWDSHMHIISPSLYPFAPSATYTTGEHDLWSALTFESALSTSGIVIVQPSLYATNNSLLLTSLRALGPHRARGVVQFPPSISALELQDWHAAGVRGVRLNLESTTEVLNSTALAARVQTYADIIRPYGWVLQLYTSMENLQSIESTLLDLNITLVLDHFASPSLPPLTPGSTEASAFSAYSVPGFPALIRLLRQGRTYVKFSAAYRVDPGMVALDTLARTMLSVRTDRMVFGSDWPHTRFEGYHVEPFVERCVEWAEEFGCVDELFGGNARRLWDVGE